LLGVAGSLVPRCSLGQSSGPRGRLAPAPFIGDPGEKVCLFVLLPWYPSKPEPSATFLAPS
jgi:hypothetical protein